MRKQVLNSIQNIGNIMMKNSLGIALLCAISFNSFANSFSSLSSFGDSMTDSGNKYAVSKALHDSTEGAVTIAADKPNLVGRSSNGKVWVEHLAEMLELESSPGRKGIETQVTVKRNNGTKNYSVKTNNILGNNWAVGGAQASGHHNRENDYFYNLSESNDVLAISGGHIFTNTAKQIEDRLAVKGNFDEHTLVTYIAGGNNLFYTLFGDVKLTAKQTAAFSIENIKALIRNGAKNIVVGNMHDAQEAPVLNKNKELADFAKQYIDDYNKELEKQTALISNLQPEVNIYFIDTNKFFKLVRDEVKANGRYSDSELGITIINTTDAAWNEQTGEVVTNPNNYMYWDTIHPTGHMHKLFAKHVADIIGSK